MRIQQDTSRILGLRMSTHVSESLILLEKTGDPKYAQEIKQSIILISRIFQSLESTDKHRVMFMTNL